MRNYELSQKLRSDDRIILNLFSIVATELLYVSIATLLSGLFSGKNNKISDR